MWFQDTRHLATSTAVRLITNHVLHIIFVVRGIRVYTRVLCMAACNQFRVLLKLYCLLSRLSAKYLSAFIQIHWSLYNYYSEILELRFNTIKKIKLGKKLKLNNQLMRISYLKIQKAY